MDGAGTGRGRAIAAARHAAGLTQEALAAATRLSVPTIKRAEAGHQTSVATMLALRRHLGPEVDATHAPATGAEAASPEARANDEGDAGTRRSAMARLVQWILAGRDENLACCCLLGAVALPLLAHGDDMNRVRLQPIAFLGTAILIGMMFMFIGADIARRGTTRRARVRAKVARILGLVLVMGAFPVALACNSATLDHLKASYGEFSRAKAIVDLRARMEPERDTTTDQYMVEKMLAEHMDAQLGPEDDPITPQNERVRRWAEARHACEAKAPPGARPEDIPTCDPVGFVASPRRHEDQILWSMLTLGSYVVGRSEVAEPYFADSGFDRARTMVDAATRNGNMDGSLLEVARRKADEIGRTATPPPPATVRPASLTLLR